MSFFDNINRYATQMHFQSIFCGFSEISQVKLALSQEKQRITKPRMQQFLEQFVKYPKKLEIYDQIPKHVFIIQQNLLRKMSESEENLFDDNKRGSPSYERQDQNQEHQHAEQNINQSNGAAAVADEHAAQNIQEISDDRNEGNNNQADAQANQPSRPASRQNQPRRANPEDHIESQPNLGTQIRIFGRNNKTNFLYFLYIIAAFLFLSFAFSLWSQRGYVVSPSNLKNDIEKLRQERRTIHKYLEVLNAHQTLKQVETIDEEFLRKIQKTRSQKLYNAGLLLLNCSKDFKEKDQQVLTYHAGIQNILNLPLNQ